MGQTESLWMIRMILYRIYNMMNLRYYLWAYHDIWVYVNLMPSIIRSSHMYTCTLHIIRPYTILSVRITFWWALRSMPSPIGIRNYIIKRMALGRGLWRFLPKPVSQCIQTVFNKSTPLRHSNYVWWKQQRCGWGCRSQHHRSQGDKSPNGWGTRLEVLHTTSSINEAIELYAQKHFRVLFDREPGWLLLSYILCSHWLWNPYDLSIYV